MRRALGHQSGGGGGGIRALCSGSGEGGCWQTPRDTGLGLGVFISGQPVWGVKRLSTDCTAMSR